MNILKGKDHYFSKPKFFRYFLFNIGIKKFINFQNFFYKFTSHIFMI